MICPRCNRDMEAGFVQAGNRMIWTKNKHKFSLLTNPHEGEKQLLPIFCWVLPALDAFYCQACDMLIIPKASQHALD